ncbi:non-ribosomal peptide synthetase [Nocardia arthritidis]|nr:non-ribosomal peptide synthetase [Nocardia arthritidis]
MDTLWGLVDGVAKRSPSRTAVTGADGAFTYEELMRRARDIAAGIRAHGLGRGDVIGVAMDRTKQLPAVLLGILGAGAAYLPLDLEWPKARIETMVSEAQAKMVIVEDFSFDPTIEVPIVCATDLHNGSSIDSSDATAEDLAYVIFTSGSTGKPKGVMVEHAGVIGVLESFAEILQLDSDWTLVAVTTLTFDISVLEIFLPLVTGGSLAIATERQQRDPNLLAELLDRAEATVLQATPITWRLLCEAGWPGRPGLIGLCGGEQMPADLIAPLLERGVQLWNVYGPTETTIWATAERITEAVPRPSIGRPLPGYYAYILDRALEPMPIGARGDLWIGGSGVARGYLGAAAKTGADRFRTDPFAPQPGRMYRTGDRARFLPDGRIEFLGREDDQVKIRGFRIEPGEIEAALARHPQVQAAVVTAPELPDGERRLVAYVRTDLAADELDILADHARTLLPSYMVPVDWVKVGSFPLNTNGKINRGALPAPQPTAGRAPKSPPRTDMEHEIARHFSRVLRKADIGRDEDFFRLGGHSLLAIEVCAGLSEMTGRDISPYLLFENPTVAGLAALFADPGALSTVTTIERAPEDLPRQPSFAQQGLAFLNMMTGGDPDAFFNQRTAFRIRGRFDKARLDLALTELIARHEVLRTTIHGEPITNVELHPARPYVSDFLDVSTLPEKERVAAAVAAATTASETSFDLTSTPLLRCLLIRIGPDDHALMLSLSHFAADWESLAIAFREIAEVYENGVGTLPELPIQYHDYAQWQRGLATTELPRQFQYWNDRLSGIQPMRLPESKPWPGQASPNGRSIQFDIPDTLREAVVRLAQQHQATLFMTLLSAFYTLIYQRTGCAKPLVAAFAQNRLRPQTRPLIGIFPNIYGLTADLSDELRFIDVVDQVRAATLDAAHNADVPFHMLLAIESVAKALDRGLSNSVLFYVIEGRPWNLELPGLAIDPWAEEIESTEYPPAANGEPDEINIGPVDLDLTFHADASSLVGTLAFNNTVFDEADMTRFVVDYLVLLEAAVENPESDLRSICAFVDLSGASR